MTTTTAPRWHLLTRQELVLVLITMIWGGTFLVVHRAMEVSGPFFFVGVRFVTAGLVIALLSGRVMSGITAREVRGGLAIGVFLFLGYFLQTWGLQTISSSKSAFITALYIPFVPLLQWAFLRRPPGLYSWVGVILAFGGLLLITAPGAGPITFEPGEIATILCAIAVAFEIIMIGRYAPGNDSRRLAAVQLLVGGLLSLALMPVFGEGVPPFSWYLLFSVLGLAAASAFIQFAVNWAQKSVSPTRATLIYAGEPVWAGLVGRIAGERLPPLALFGAALIVGGVIVSSLKKEILDDAAEAKP